MDVDQFYLCILSKKMKLNRNEVDIAWIFYIGDIETHIIARHFPKRFHVRTCFGSSVSVIIGFLRERINENR